MNSVDFQDEAAVKDYLDRLGIEYRFQCFHEERPDGCHRLGDWLEFAKKDWAKAGRIFKSNCDLYEYGHSCFKYGNYLFLGRGMKEKDKTKATEYYKKGCDAKDVYPGACFNYGVSFMKEDLSASTSDQHDHHPYAAVAMKALQKGCELKDAPSCHIAFQQYMTGKHFQKDFAKAFHFAKKGCELDDPTSCANLSRMFKRGDGVEANELLAKEYREKAEKLQSETDPKANVTFGK